MIQTQYLQYNEYMPVQTCTQANRWAQRVSKAQAELSNTSCTEGVLVFQATLLQLQQCSTKTHISRG